jgi:hypothetical protein
MISVINEISNDSIMIKYNLKLRGVEIIIKIIAFNLCNIVLQIIHKYIVSFNLCNILQIIHKIYNL